MPTYDFLYAAHIQTLMGAESASGPAVGRVTPRADEQRHVVMLVNVRNTEVQSHTV